MKLGRSIVGALDRLAALDDRLMRRGTSRDEAAMRRPDDPTRWRQPPYFYWRHRWSRADIMALILVGVGLWRTVAALGRAHYVAGLGWLTMIVGGALLFVVCSLAP